MRIESIKIQNLRQLKDVMVRFVKRNDENDLHIILAENGVGKTNILNAITWCLYNKEMHLRDEESALPIVNSQVAEETRQYGGGNVEVSVELVIATEDDNKMTFKRVGLFNITDSAIIGLDDKLTISYLGDGGYRIVEEEEDTLQLIHKYLPEEINSYIFFDGEQLEKFFSSDQLNNVKTGINELTQASYLKKAYMYMENYIKDYISPRISNSGDKDIKEQQEKVDDLEEQINLSEETITTYNNQISECENVIEELNNKIHGCENVREKAEDLKNSELRLNNLNDSLSNKNAELMKFTREYFILFSLFPSIKHFHDYIERQKNDGKLPPNIDTRFLDRILEEKECLVCGKKHLTEEDLQAVRQLRKTISVASETSNELSNALGAMTSYFLKIDDYTKTRNKLVNEIKNLDRDIEKEEDNYRKLDSYLRSIPDNEDVAKALEQRDNYKKQHIDLISKRAKEEERLKNNTKVRDEEDKKLRALTAKKTELTDFIRKRDFCESCIKTMKESMREILDECRVSIQNETFRIFDNLIWKKDAFSKVEILENYSFRLLDKYGNQTLGSCSAAETALLALSFTLALQLVSKHDSLLFIDTPIGRVGVQNRTNFMNTLLKVAKEKQVILTFTPTEYDTNVKTILADNYNSFHSLTMEEGVTTIKSK